MRARSGAANEERVTPLELFFDLIFVFAITLAVELPVLATLGVVAGVMVTLTAYEAIHLAAARDRVRHPAEAST